MYTGGARESLKTKINKVLDAFSVEKYTIPEEYSHFTEKFNQVEKQLVEIKNVHKSNLKLIY